MPATVADPNHLVRFMAAAKQSPYGTAAAPAGSGLPSAEALAAHAKGGRPAPWARGSRDHMRLLWCREHGELRGGASETAVSADRLLASCNLKDGLASRARY